jgi:hypothetical protein
MPGPGRLPIPPQGLPTGTRMPGALGIPSTPGIRSTISRDIRRSAGPSYRVNDSSRWLKAQAFCLIPEQVLLSNAPGQPPLSRSIAHIDRKFIR